MALDNFEVIYLEMCCDGYYALNKPESRSVNYLKFTTVLPLFMVNAFHSLTSIMSTPLVERMQVQETAIRHRQDFTTSATRL